MEKWGDLRPRGVAALCLAAIRYRFARGRLKKFLGSIATALGPSFDVEIDGLRMRCNIGDNITERRLVYGRLSRQESDSIAMATDDLKLGDTFVDIGANCGLFTLHAARKVGCSGRVIAIEPMPDMLDRLRFNISANRFKNIDVVPSAIGAAEGIATLYVNEHQRGQSTMAKLERYLPIAVPVIPLATAASAVGMSRIDTLKIDIEGYEDRALVPFINAAPRHIWPRKIFMETVHRSRWETDCVQHLVEAGYEIAWSDEHDVLLARGDGGRSGVAKDQHHHPSRKLDTREDTAGSPTKSAA